jgi:peroxiredoxin
MTAVDTLQHPPAVGEQAPDFTLPSTSGASVVLSSFRGQRSVLVAFFPLAFTSVCTAEMCAFSDDYDALAATGTTVLPISVDSVPTLKEFKAKHGMKVDLLSDFKRETSRRWGVLREDTFFSQRAYFLVDRDGIVRWAHVETTPGQRRDNAEILERIAALG